MAQGTAGVTHARDRHAAAHDPDPKAIAARIEHSRGEISKTLAAIAERLSPERLAGEAIGAAVNVAEQAEAAAAKMAAQAEKAADAEVKGAVSEAESVVRTLTD
jgi:hypothetical protein